MDCPDIVFCSNRKVWLYPDLEYTNALDNSEEVKRIQKRSMEKEEALKPKKKPKVVKEAAALEDDGHPEMKAIGKGQIARLENPRKKSPTSLRSSMES